MEKSIEEYILELKEFQKRSKNYIQANAIINNDNEPYRGRLIFNITHSRGTFPVPNALITIYDGDTIIKAVGTDESGKSPTITLDAFDKKFTESPTSNLGNITKFYDAKIEADNFVPALIQNIPIYENVTTLQSYDMLFRSAVNNNDMQIVTLPTDVRV